MPVNDEDLEGFGSSNIVALPRAASASVAPQPNEAAKAVSMASGLGLPPSVIGADLETFQQADRGQKAAQAIERNGWISDYVARNPMAAEVSSDDYDNLEKVSKAIQPFTIAGRQGGLLQAAPEFFLHTIPETATLLSTAEGRQRLLTGLEKFGTQFTSILATPGDVEKQGFDIHDPVDMERAQSLGLLIGLGKQSPKVEAFPRIGRSTPGEVDAFLHQAEGFKTRAEIDEFLAGKAAPGKDPKQVLQIEMAKADSAKLDDAVAVAEASNTKARSPQMLEDFIAGHDTNNIHLPAEAVADLYRAEGKVPVEGDGLFGFVPGLSRDLALGVETGAEVTVPASKYIAHIDPAVHEKIKDLIRFRPEGLTVEEAKEAKPESQDLVVYHGSGAKFDEFDSSKIGSGQGAQSYGHGLYVAEHPEVARGYPGGAAGKSPYFYTAKLTEPKANFLDLDKPLNEQSPSVREKLKQIPQNVFEQLQHLSEEHGLNAPESGVDPNFTGRHLYKYLTKLTEEGPIFKIDETKSTHGTPEEEVSLYLHSLGIPGLRYLDKLSRKIGEGTSNIVIFDPKTAKITQRNEDVFGQAAQAEETELGLRPMFSEPPPEMTKPEFERYNRRVKDAQQAILDKAARQIEAEKDARLTKEWKAQEAAVREEMAGAVAARPDIATESFLKKGKLKLDTETIDAMLPDNSIPAALKTSGGAHPDDIATFVGYESGAELVKGLNDLITERKARGESPTKQLDRLITEATASAMEARHGDFGRQIAEEARTLALDDIHFDLLSDELRVLARQAGGQPPLSKDALKEWVSGQFSSLDTKAAADFGRWQKAAGREGRKAEQALLKGDAVEAFKAKQRQVLSWLMAKEANRFAKDISKIAAKIDRVMGKPPKDVIPDNKFLKQFDKADLELPPEAERAVSNFVGGGPSAIKEGQEFGIMDESRLEAAFGKEDPFLKDIASVIRNQLETAISPIKKALRSEYGNYITLYRVQTPDVTGKPSRMTLSLTSNLNFAHEYAGVYKKSDLFSETEIQKAERDYAKNDEVKIGRITLKKGEYDSVEIWDPEVGGFVTDTPSVREFIEDLNKDRVELNKQSEDRENQLVQKFHVPVENIIWYTNRFGQNEFIIKTENGRVPEQSFKGSSIPSMDQEYFEQLRAMLFSAGFEARTPITEGMISLADFVAASDGQLAVASWLTDGAQRPADPSKLTAQEMRDLGKSIDSMIHVGRAVKTLDSARGKAELQNVVFDIKAELDRFDLIAQPLNPSIPQRAKSLVRWVNAWSLLVERMLDYTDRFDPNGPLTTYMDRPLRDANVKEIQLNERATRKLQVLSKLTDNSINDIIPNSVIPSELNESGFLDMNRRNLRQLMGYMGSKSGIKKVTQGFGVDEAAVWKLINDNATKADWQWVAGMHELFETLWKESAEMQERDTGVAADPVKAKVMKSEKHGDFPGGYWPIKYDRMRSNIEGHIAAKSDLFDKHYIQAVTPQAYTEARTQFAAPLDLSGQLIGSHIRGMIHDIAFREAVRNAAKLINNAEFMAAMTQKWSKEYAGLLPGWIKDIANAQRVDDSYAMGAARWSALVRQNITSTLIALNPGTVIKHGMSALGMSIERVGARELGSAAVELGAKAMIQSANELIKGKGEPPTQERLDALKAVTDPSEIGDQVRQFIIDSSAVMRNRQRASADNIREAYQQNIKSGAAQTFVGARNAWMDIGRFPVALSDAVSAMPTWLAAYKEAMTRGEDHTQAVFEADKQVSRAHGSSFIGDRPRIMRTDEVMRWVTPLYNFWNHMQNNYMQWMWDAEAWAKGREEPGANIGSLSRRVFWLAIWSIAAEEIASPALDEDRRSLGQKVFMATLRHFGAGYIGVRDVTNAAAHGYEPSVGLLGTLSKEIAGTGREMARVGAGKELSKNWLIHAMTALGFATGLGGAQLGKTSSYIKDRFTGAERAGSFDQLRQGLRTGHSRPRIHK